jgi:RNA-directed DNA polymerase
MKRVGGLFDQIAEWDNLRLAAYRAAKGKRNRGAVQSFLSNLEDEIACLRAGLLGDHLSIGSYMQFSIQDPKPRVITAPCFRERVLHHAIMNVCEPYFERWQVDQSFACRVGKGRVEALKFAARQSRRHRFFLKMDIRQFFGSIPHQPLIDRLQRRFKDLRLLGLFKQIIGAFETSPRVGLPIGSLTSQHLANFYLGAWDQQLQERLGCQAMARYMDDCILWGRSSGDLCRIAEQSARWLGRELGLTLKPWTLQRTALGLPFLGFVLRPEKTALNRRSRVRLVRRRGHCERLYLAGRLSGSELQSRVTALYAFRDEVKGL